jgi:hypothetical protein
VWAIAADKVFIVMRQDISVVANPYFYFGADSTEVRGTMRLGYGFSLRPLSSKLLRHRQVRKAKHSGPVR